MSTFTVASVVAKARAYVLQDSSGVRWTDPEALAWFNEFQHDLVTYRPSAFVKVIEWPIAVGVRQALPPDCVLLIDIPANKSGRAVRICKRELLDAKAPTWRAHDQSDDIRHFMFSDADPNAFHVYPPNTGFGIVELVYGAYPPALTDISQSTVLAEVYAAAAVDYIIYRMLSKDADTADDSRAAAHHAAYISAITGKAQSDAANSPNQTAPASK